MQVVIDVCEDDFNILKKQGEDNIAEIRAKFILNAVKNGTVLPEVHGKLKDVNQIRAQIRHDLNHVEGFLCQKGKYSDQLERLDTVRAYVNSAPTVIDSYGHRPLKWKKFRKGWYQAYDALADNDYIYWTAKRRDDDDTWDLERADLTEPHNIKRETYNCFTFAACKELAEKLIIEEREKKEEASHDT